MQKTIIFIVWAFAALLIQTAILHDFPSTWIWLDPLFYLVIILALRFRLFTAVLVTCVLGYLADTVSYVPYGATLVSYLITLLLVRTVKENIYIEDKVSLFFWIVIFSIVRQVIQISFISIKAGGAGFGFILIGRMILQSVWDGILGLVLIPLLDKLLFKEWWAAFRRKGLRD